MAPALGLGVLAAGQRSWRTKQREEEPELEGCHQHVLNGESNKADTKETSGEETKSYWFNLVLP
jgi:hypothetical protein